VRLLPLYARFLDQVDERRRAAVHDRHFRGVQLDDDVVDAHADKRRQQMLNRFDGYLIPRQPCGELDARQVVDGGRHLEIAEVGPTKTDPVVSRRRFQRKVDLVAGVKTDSDTGDGATKCTLYVH